MSNDTSARERAERGLFRDFTNALGQQMFFWGRDVIHADGNLLCEFGLEKRKSEGLDGTSCYRMEYEGDTVELHGACVGRYSSERPGFLYIRNRARCFLYWNAEPPAPGFYNESDIVNESPGKLHAEGRKFLKWWLEYEQWIADKTAPGYRDNCFRAFRKLPKSKSWLPPGQARKWLNSYYDDPENLSRARVWKHEGEKNTQ